MNPEFSIVITTYNRALLLKRALDSLIAQTEKNWNAWVIDDGSEDDTKAVVAPYLESGFPISYVFQENSGEVNAKNRGVFLSNGSYITFLDSDDEYLPDHLETRHRILAAHPDTDLLHGGVRVVGDPFVPDLYNPGNKKLISECVVGATFFYKKDCIFSLKGFNPLPLGSDAELFERTVKAGFKIVKTDLPTYIYHRTNLDSITHTFWKNMNK